MSGFLLHLGATVLCMHGGQAMPVTTNPRVRVSGQPVVQVTHSYTIAGCPFTTGGSYNPCVTAQWLSSAVRVTSNGIPLLLDNSQATCTPNGTGVNIVATQIRVKGT